jgi:hypothetical protein
MPLHLSKSESRRLKKSPLGYVLFALVILFYGVALIKSLPQFFHDAPLVVESCFWPQSDAILDRSWLQISVFRGITDYSLEIEYHFNVFGTSYKGSCFRAPNRPFSGNKENALRQLARYAATSSIKVYYDPNNPNRSVVERSIWDWVYLALEAVLLLFLTIFMSLVGYASIKKILLKKYY